MIIEINDYVICYLFDLFLCRLIILSLDPDNDYGNYTCTATNALGSAVGYIEVSGE